MAEENITRKEFHEGMDELKDLIVEKTSDLNDKITSLMVAMATYQTKSADNKEEIDLLRKQSNKNDVIIAVIGAVGIILAAIFAK